MKRLALTVTALAFAAGCNCGVGIDQDGGVDGGLGDGGQGSLCLVAASCYTGPVGTQGTGACRAGTAQCIDNALGPCIGEVLPSTESCNGLDDDCNSAVDDQAILGNVSCGLGACKVTVGACSNGRPSSCVPATPTTERCGDGVDNNCDGAIDEGCVCTYVSPGGVDTNPGTAVQPVRSITAGIAVAVDAGIRQVCVAAGAACPATGAYNESVVMVNGVSVFGAYEASYDGGVTDGGLLWPRLPICVVRISAQDDRGVYFGAAVASPTSIDGFNILASNGATNAAVTVDGSLGAVINNNAILGGGGQSSVAISVLGNAAPTISRNQITGGGGALSAIGVKSVGSKPSILDNCGAFSPQGRCAQYCFNGARFIRGRLNASVGSTSYAVKLESSPGAVVERSALCSGPAATDSAAVRLTGDGTGVQVRASILEAFGAGSNAVGFWTDECGAAAPWVFDNTDISGNSPVLGARADGVRAVGACHPRIDSNVRIIGGQESSNNDAIGVYCAKDPSTGISSRCTVQNNTLIAGSIAGFPPTSTGVKCDPGACALVTGNRITGRGGVRTFGLVLNGAATVVRKNDIEGGCASVESIGLLSIDSASRVDNNTIRGALCTGVATLTPLSTAIKVLVGTGANEVDLNSNTVPPFGARGGVCTSRGLVFDISDGGTPGGARSVVRNNILHGGVCSTAVPVFEIDVSSDPRIFENNDLYVLDGGLYMDEGSSSLPDVASVNALTGSVGNVSGDPTFDGGIRLGPTSLCRNAGVATGAPPDDFEGDARPQEATNDIGADEYRP